jgi:hypothetical protein
MALGIEIRLYDGATARSPLSDLICLWWDSVDVGAFQSPVGCTRAASIDAQGYLILDLSAVSSLTAGEYGYLLVRREGESNHKEALVFQGRVSVTDSVSSGTVLAAAGTCGVPSHLLLEASDNVLLENEYLVLTE